MTAQDYETREGLINPYIVVSKPGKGSVFLNTQSFRNCQDSLIHPLDDVRLTPLLDSQKYYLVEAVVGEYNGAIPGDNPVKVLIRTVSIGRRERSRTLLGYLDEDTIRVNLPRSFLELSSPA